MTASVVVVSCETRDLEPMPPGLFREVLGRKLGAGHRLVTLFGRRQGDQVVVTAATREADLAPSLIRAHLPAQSTFDSLTRDHPAAGCFERELHEQTGVAIGGHPWLKPIRFAGNHPSSMDAYPFYQVVGKEVHEVAVGPIHAGVIEPGAFRFMCLGEQVHHLEIHLGYQHRGVEQRLLERDPRALGPLVETIAGDSSIANAWAYAAAIEALSGVQADAQIDVARAILLELERIAMHLASLAGLAADIGFLQGASTYGRLRTTAINTTMRLSGSRFGRGAIRPGGVVARLAQEAVSDAITVLQRDLPIIDECFLGALSVQHRLRDVGRLTSAQARELGLVGLAARASGLAVDLRHAPEGGVYRDIPVSVATHADGDCWARACVRVAESGASLEWLAKATGRHPAWDHPRSACGPLAPGRVVLTAVEGFRGEVVHCIETDERGALLHYKVQDPSLRNWMGLAIAVRGEEISDFPICNKSFDLSYCGNDL